MKTTIKLVNRGGICPRCKIEKNSNGKGLCLDCVMEVVKEQEEKKSIIQIVL